jgi:hypothetical protein
MERALLVEICVLVVVLRSRVEFSNDPEEA